MKNMLHSNVKTQQRVMALNLILRWKIISFLLILRVASLLFIRAKYLSKNINVLRGSVIRVKKHQI